MEGVGTLQEIKMNKVRELNKIAEMQVTSDYDLAANSLHLASVFVKAADQATDKMSRYKWLKSARDKVEIATFFLDSLQGG